MAAPDPHVDHGWRTVISCLVFTIVAAIFVGIRSILRFVYLRNSGYEDHTILIALFFSIGFTVFAAARMFRFSASFLLCHPVERMKALTHSRETTWTGKTYRDAPTRRSSDGA